MSRYSDDQSSWYVFLSMLNKFAIELVPLNKKIMYQLLYATAVVIGVLPVSYQGFLHKLV